MKLYKKLSKYILEYMLVSTLITLGAILPESIKASNRNNQEVKQYIQENLE